MSTSIAIVPFDRKYDRSSFDCSNASLNDFLAKFASQYEKRNIGRTYIAVTTDQQIAGYYTLASSSIDVSDLPEDVAKRFAQQRIPVLLLGRLAIGTIFQKQGLGGQLLSDAFDKCLAVANQVGVFAIYVEAIDESAMHFYEKYGFVPFPANPLKMYLPIDTFDSI